VRCGAVTAVPLKPGVPVCQDGSGLELWDSWGIIWRQMGDDWEGIVETFMLKMGWGGFCEDWKFTAQYGVRLNSLYRVRRSLHVLGILLDVGYMRSNLSILES
jgi:hypothetical protein